jgi:hypothetical protein
MAQRILKHAAQGVRDPVRLRATALIGAVDGSKEATSKSG